MGTRTAETVGVLQGLLDRKRHLEIEIQKIDSQLEEHGISDLLDKIPESGNLQLIKSYFANQWFNTNQK